LAVVAVIESPFVAFGIYKFIVWITKKLKIRSGHVFARFILPNRQEKEVLSKPEGNQIKVKGKDFGYDSKKLTYRGNEPIATYDSKKVVPIDLLTDLGKNEISSDEISQITIRAFNLGMISGTNVSKRMAQYILFILIGVIIIGLIGLYNISIISGMGNTIDALPELLTNTINSGIESLRGVATNVPT